MGTAEFALPSSAACTGIGHLKPDCRGPGLRAETLERMSRLSAELGTLFLMQPDRLSLPVPVLTSEKKTDSRVESGLRAA